MMKLKITYLILTVTVLISGFLYSQTNIHSITREWGTYFHGDNMVLDEVGNIWIASSVTMLSVDYINQIITPDAHQSVFSGETDGFIAKLSPDGELLYASYFGGEGNDVIYSIDAKDGKVYIAGTTTSESNIATSGTYQEEYLQNIDPNGNPYIDGNSGFIVQLDYSGQVQWGSYFQGNRTLSLGAVGVGNDNDVYIYGSTNSSNLATTGVFQEIIAPPFVSSNGNLNAPNYPVLARFDDTGQLIWTTYYGPDILAQNTISLDAADVAIDFSNNVYISGRSNDTASFYGTTDAHQPSNAGETDFFIAKFNPMGQRVWGTYYGGLLNEHNPKIAIPRDNILYISGTTQSDSHISTPGSWQENFMASFNCSFLAKFDLDGNRLWGTYIGNNNGQFISVDVDVQGNVYVCGAIADDESIITEGSWQEIYAGGNRDSFFLKFNPQGDELLWGSYYGGSDLEQSLVFSKTIRVSDNNNVFLSGSTFSMNNIASEGAFEENHYLNGDFGVGFIAKFVYCPEVVSPVAVSPQAYEPGATLEDLEVEFFEWTGSNLIITWYADEEGTVELPLDTELVDGETYYVSQQIQGCDESELTPVTVIETTMGIDTPIQYQIVLYPNPNKGTFYIDGIKEKTRIQVFDLQGRQLKEAITSEPVYEVDLGDSTASGLYLVKVEAQGGRIQQFKVLID